MNLKENIIVVKGLIKTHQIERIEPGGEGFIVKFAHTDKEFRYGSDIVVWLRNPKEVNLDNTQIRVKGRYRKDVLSIFSFHGSDKVYYAIEYEDPLGERRDGGLTEQYSGEDVEIRRSCLKGEVAVLLEYFTLCATIRNKTIPRNEEVTKDTSESYQIINFVDVNSAAAIYMQPERQRERYHVDSLIFPFSFDSAQSKAVRNALQHQISVVHASEPNSIRDTVLNIIANLLLHNKTVLVAAASDAVQNNILKIVKEMGLKFLMVKIGHTVSYGTRFILSLAPVPDLSSWHRTDEEMKTEKEEVALGLKSLESYFERQDKLTDVRTELQAIDHATVTDSGTDCCNVAEASELYKLSDELKELEEYLSGSRKSILKRFNFKIKRSRLQSALKSKAGITDRVSSENIGSIITAVERLYRFKKAKALREEIYALKTEPESQADNGLMSLVNEKSLSILHAFLEGQGYCSRMLWDSQEEIMANSEEFINDHPVVVSLAHLAKKYFSMNALFDYVIFPDASRISAETGILGLTCAKNAVLIGDPSKTFLEVTEEQRSSMHLVRKELNVDDKYKMEGRSLLRTVSEVIPSLPTVTLYPGL